MKKSILLSFIFFMASIWGETPEAIGSCGVPERPSNSCEPLPKCSPPLPNCAPPPCPPPPCMTLPPLCKNPCQCIGDKIVLTSAANICNANMYVFLDALYWLTNIGNSDWGLKGEDFTSSTGEATKVISNYAANFKFAFGGRLGLGFNTQLDGWDINLYYTWFRDKSLTEIILGSGVGAWALHEPAVADFTQGINKWVVLFHCLDWELARAYFVSHNLILRPYLGLKLAYISQKVIETFQGGSGNEIYNLKLQFEGLGPKGGINTKWIFSNCNQNNMYIFGDFEAALMCGRLKNTRQEPAYKIQGAKEIITHFKRLDQTIPHPMMRYFMGIGWQARLASNTLNFDARIGYEIQYWFRQNQFIHRPVLGYDDVKIAPTYFRLSDDLAFQGFTLKLGLDF